MKHSCLLTTGFLVFLISTSAQADLLLDLKFADSSGSSVVTSGSTVLVDLFLTDTDASTSLTTRGLNSGGGRLLQTAGTAIVTDNVATMPGFLGSETWFPPSLIAPAVPGIASVAVASTFPGTVGVGTTTVHIARFSLTVLGAIGDVATLTADVLGGGVVGNSIPPSLIPPLPPVDLDAVLTGGGGTFGAVDITIAAVPEASTLLVAAILGGGFFLRRRRKLRLVDSTADVPLN